MYDTDNDGVLIEDDLYQVLRAMMTENGMHLKVEEVKHLANLLFTWIVFPFGVWLLDKTLRVVNVYFGSGATKIKTGLLLPSNVTRLVIQRPAKFNFNAGDWVFVNVPAVAPHEWHPFLESYKCIPGATAVRALV